MQIKEPEQYTPATLEEAIDYLFECCDDEDLNFIRTEGKSQAVEMEGPNGPIELNIYGYTMHHGYGQMIRNAWLWNPNSKLNHHFRERFGLGHADDMSGLIMDGLEAKVRNLPYSQKMINGQVEHYKKHWAKIGQDPMFPNQDARTN